MLGQTASPHQVHHVPSVGPTTGAKGFTLDPLQQWLALPLVGDGKGGREAIAQPSLHLTQVFPRFVVIAFSRLSRGRRGQIHRCGVEVQGIVKVLIALGQLKEHLIRQMVVGVVGRVVGLNKVDVKVSLGHRRGPLIRCPKEKIALAGGATLLPFQIVMLPDFIARQIGLVFALQGNLQRIVVVAIELGILQAFRPFLN